MFVGIVCTILREAARFQNNSLVFYRTGLPHERPLKRNMCEQSIICTWAEKVIFVGVLCTTLREAARCQKNLLVLYRTGLPHEPA